MEVWQAIVLGLTQGLTEFLPVSSSGHLLFFQRVLGIDIGGAEMFFNIIMHLGTLIAVCAVFWKDIINLFKKPFKTLLYLVVATIPAAIVGLLLEDKIDEVFVQGSHAGIFLGIFFMITAGILFATEIFAKRRKKTLPLCFRTTVPMGLAQCVALLPGISRSGSTIAAGTFAGGTADDISKFSFLMSIPVILGSFAVSLLKGMVNGELHESVLVAGDSFGICVVVGLIFSAVSGLFAIKVMLAAIKKADYKWFSAYLVAIGLLSIVLQSVGVF